MKMMNNTFSLQSRKLQQQQQQQQQQKKGGLLFIQSNTTSSPTTTAASTRQRQTRRQKRRRHHIIVIIISMAVLILCIQIWAYLRLTSTSTYASSSTTTSFMRSGTTSYYVSNKQKLKNKEELFLDRINRLLPEDDNTTQLTIDDIFFIEQELFNFNIPRPITVQVQDAAYISIVLYRWLFHDQQQKQKQPMCPNCYIRYDPWIQPKGQNESYYYTEFVRNHKQSQQAYQEYYKNQQGDNNNNNKNNTTITTTSVLFVPDVKLHPGCPHPGLNITEFQDTEWQVLIGGCGESQEQPNGKPYAQKGGRRQFHYHSGFEKIGNGLFETTFAYLHLCPPDEQVHSGGVFPQGLFTMTDYAKQILKQHLTQPSIPTLIVNNTKQPKALPSMFVHGNCANDRGIVLQGLTRMEPPTYIARYGPCYHNREEPDLTKNIRNCPKPYSKHWNLWSHYDCEGNIYSTKTVLSAYHKFTFALENAHSQDYISEKRWQAYLAGSVPIIWDNHNSLDTLPHINSALIVQAPTYQMKHNNDWGKSLAKHLLHRIPNQLIRTFQRYSEDDNNEEYIQRFFSWKTKQTLPVNFVRKMFLSADFLICRICEHVAHHHQRGGG